MANDKSGGCACGAVRYRLMGDPMFVHCCHCHWCQRETGSAFVLNALYETDRVVTVRGEPQAITIPTHSGDGQQILRCPSCSVALWSHYSGAREAIAFVRVGTLDEPGQMPPDIHIFTESKLTWLPLPPGIPALPRFYKWEEYWSAESLERRRAALAAQPRS